MVTILYRVARLSASGASLHWWRRVSPRRLAADRAPAAATPLHEAAFLIAAVADATARYGVPHGALAVRSGPRQRLVWLIDFFAQLERRDQFGRAGP